LAKATSKITAALREIGVIYRVEGKGRGARATSLRRRSPTSNNSIGRTQVSFGSPRAAFYPEASVMKPMVLKRITGLIGSMKGVAD
jgi:hypothetical protein